MPATQADFRTFEKLFNQIKRAKTSKRREATGTLTPAVMRQHLSSGAPLSLLYGRRSDGTPFTFEDLKEFAKQAKEVRKTFSSAQAGVRSDQLIAASRTVDIERSKSIRSAVLYRLFNSKSGFLLKFRVSASPGSQYTSHQVVIRLDEWQELLTSTVKFSQAAKQILNGRISFDCDCGRHQYWYRYLATIGGFAVTPPAEHSFPKIRNPKLTGACCKHVLKAIVSMRGAAVQRMIIGEMQKEAEKIGFGGDSSTASRFLNQKELSTAERSSRAAGDVDQGRAIKAFQDFIRAKKGIQAKFKEPEVKMKMDEARKKIEAKAAAMEKIARHEKARADKAEADLKKHMAESRAQVITDIRNIAKANGWSAEMLDQAIKGLAGGQ